MKWKPGSVDERLHGTSAGGLCYTLNLLPTIAEVFGRRSPTVWDGQSFAAAFGRESPSAGATRPPGRDELILSQCAGTCQRSVRWDRYLYIRTYHDGYNVLPRELLFDVVFDPNEVSDLAPSRPALCREAVYRIDVWHEHAANTRPLPPSTSAHRERPMRPHVESRVVYTDAYRYVLSLGGTPGGARP